MLLPDPPTAAFSVMCCCWVMLAGSDGSAALGIVVLQLRIDARNDLRLVTGVLAGNRMREIGPMPIPSSVNSRVRGDDGCQARICELQGCRGADNPE
jgi:hypothetical protein